LDLRGRLSVAELLALLSQAQALITADTGSVTLAGAFENWIGFIATSAHPEYVLPWRNGSQSYRTASLERARLYDMEGRQPSAIEHVTRRWPAAQLRASFSEPSSIVEFVRAANDA
jgi:ADP-heptose:LPS heptosyltransferase